MIMNRCYTSVIIPAAGQGRRMKASLNKQYLLLKGKPILAYTLDAFENCLEIKEIIVVVNKDELKLCEEEIIKPYGYKKATLVEGGLTRQESVYNGLKKVSKEATMVMVHDGARPMIEETVILKSIGETKKNDATVVGVLVKNTIKIINDKGFVEETPNRESLIEIQTPQTFKYGLLKKAHENALSKRIIGTDDAFLVEKLNVPVKIIMGKYSNIKITTPEDMIIAESLLNLVE